MSRVALQAVCEWVYIHISTLLVHLIHFNDFGYDEWSTLPVEPPLAFLALYRKALSNRFVRFPQKSAIIGCVFP